MNARARALIAMYLAVGGLAVGIAVTSSPSVVTKTVRPFLGGVRHGTVIPSQRGYRPRHGNAEHAVFRSAGGCGVERWAVKTLTDPAAGSVTLAPQDTVVSDLTSIAPPVEPTDRVNPTEDTTFRLTGSITFVKREADGDYHMVVDDGQGNTMIVESTDPACASGSRVLPQIESVRRTVEGQLAGAQLPVRATLTGVGFFDRLHGQTGVAPNGIELHPLTSIQIGGGAAKQSVRLARAAGGD